MLFGILSIATIKVIQPVLTEFTEKIPLSSVTLICSILSIYFLLDTIITAYKVLQLGGKLKEMSILFEEIKEKSDGYKVIVQQNINKFDGLIDSSNEKIIFAKEQINKLKIRLEKVIIKNKSNSKRIIKAFPNIKSLKYQYSLDKLKEELKRIRKK